MFVLPLRQLRQASKSGLLLAQGERSGNCGYLGGKAVARYLEIVSNSASEAWAPLLAIWSTRAFQRGASRLCWAATSGEWHWEQTRTITSRPGPSGRLL